MSLTQLLCCSLCRLGNAADLRGSSQNRGCDLALALTASADEAKNERAALARAAPNAYRIWRRKIPHFRQLFIGALRLVQRGKEGTSPPFWSGSRWPRGRQTRNSKTRERAFPRRAARGEEPA